MNFFIAPVPRQGSTVAIASQFPGPMCEQAGTVTVDERLMAMALAEARRALADRHFPCGCVLVRAGEVVASGCNEVYRRKDPTRHGEMVALEAAFRHLDGSSILLPGSTAYVTVEPCLMCAGALLQAGVARVVFGTRSGDYGSLRTEDVLRSHGLTQHVSWEGGVLADECQALLREWTAYKQRILAQAKGRSGRDVGALLDQEGLTAAHLAAWQTERAAIDAERARTSPSARDPRYGPVA